MSLSNEQYQAFLSNNSLNFEVATVQNLHPITGEPVKGKFSTMRTDTQEIFDMGFSQSYRPIQNHEAFSVLQRIADERDIEIIKGGAWAGGAEVFAQIDLGDTRSITSSQDQVSKYLTVITSHNGSAALTLALTPFRIACANQINMVRKATNEDSMTRIRISHSNKGIQILGDLNKNLEIIDNQFDFSITRYQHLAHTKLTEDQYFDVIFRSLYPQKNIELSPRVLTGIKTLTDNVETRRLHADGGVSDVDSAWNVYNAIQGTYQHNPQRVTQTHEKSVLIGNAARKSADVLGIIEEVIAPGYETLASKNIQRQIEAMMA